MHKSWLPGAILALAPTTAFAAPLNWDCDTAAGSFSQLSQVQPGPAYRVRGTIRWVQSRVDRHYAPSGHIMIGNLEGGRWVGIQMVATPGSPRIRFGVRSQSGGEPQEEMLGDAALNEAVPFELSVSASGEATASIGGQRRTLQIEVGANTTVQATCSTGEFQFFDLELAG